MHSTCDCYCKTRVPITRQRKEIHSERGRVIPSSKSLFGKAEAIRSAKAVPLIPAKLVDDEELDSNTTVTLPVSPVLSPETTAALEDTERLIKDAEIRIKEIITIGNLGRVRNYINTWPDETFLDDENNHLLYIRERVACEFQEANGWIDTNQLSPQNEECFDTKIKPKKGIDFSHPKFQTSEERYQEYLQRRKLQVQKLGLSVPIVDNVARNIEETKNSNEKINTCTVQTVPSVDIRAELRAQSLKSIHISPDTSFVQENLNVAAFEINHDQKNPRPVRKEKFVKILEENKTTNTKKKGRNSKEFDEIESNDSSTSVSKETPEKVTIKSFEVPQKNIQEPNSKVDAQKTVESNLNDDGVDLGDEKLEENEKLQFIQNISKDKQDVDNLIKKTNVETKNDQKQVRFNDEVLEENPEKREEERVELKFKSSEYSSAPKDEINEHTPLSSNETETRHLMNKRRHEEVCGKRKCKKDERYRIVDQRFCDVLKKYCDQEINPSKPINFVKDSSEDSSDQSSISDLYEPSMDLFDDLLTKYNKIINNVIQSTKTIDKFLSRPEYSNEFFKNQEETTKSNHLRPLRRKDSVSKHKSSSTNKNINKERQGRMKTSSIKFTKGDNNSRKSFGTSKRSNKFAGRTESRRNEQSECIKNKESTDGQKIRGINDLEENCSSKKLLTGRLPVSSVVSSSLVSSSSSSSSSSLSIKSQGFNEGKIFQAADVRNVEKNDLDYVTLYDDVCSKVLKEILPETSNMERSILQVLQQETRFIENKIKSVFNVDEIVPVLAKGLLEHLKSNVLNFESVTLTNQKISKTENNEEILRVEENFSATEITKDIVDVQSINDSKNETSATEEINKMDSKSSKETSETNSHKISSKNSPENVILSNDVKEDESLSSAKNFSENCEDLAKKENKNDVEQNINKEENLCEDVLVDFDKISEIIEDKETQDLEQKNSINLNQEASILSNAVSEVREENCTKSVQNIEKDKISSSDSLKDCASLQSSKNVSKMSSNIVESPGKINKTDKILEINNENPSGTVNVNNLGFDKVFEKDKILSEVYENVHKKIFSSTFDTNYSSLLNQNWRLSSSVSAIESKVLTSSNSSHSEGELHMPSSGSYSAGEVRMLTKNRSDGENTDDDITVFLTEQMLTSWNESSKALVQSMGEI